MHLSHSFSIFLTDSKVSDINSITFLSLLQKEVRRIPARRSSHSLQVLHAPAHRSSRGFFYEEVKCESYGLTMSF